MSTLPFFVNRMDFNNLTMQIQMLVPSLKLMADYEMEGKLLMLPVVGNGDCTLKFSKSHHDVPH